jgi:hypothetical protein
MLQASYIRWAHPRAVVEKKKGLFFGQLWAIYSPLSDRRGAGGEVKRIIGKRRHCERSEAISLKTIFIPTERILFKQEN